MPRIRHPPLTPAQRERRSTTTFREFFWALEKSPWRGGERGGSIVLAFPSSATATNRSTGFHFVNAVAFPNDNNPRKVSPLGIYACLAERNRNSSFLGQRNTLFVTNFSREGSLSSIKCKNWTIFDTFRIILCAFLSFFFSYRFLLHYLTKVKIISKQ